MKLQDICEKATSNIAQKDISDRNGIYPIYGASGFIKNIDSFAIDTPYIGIVKDGAGVGRVMLLPAKSSVIGTMQYILPKRGVDVAYLRYLLESMDLSKYGTGATIPHIYFKDYGNEQVKEYSETEQKRIADELDKVSGLIEKRQKQLEKLDLLIKSRFVEMFSSEESLKWGKAYLGNVCDVRDGTHDSPKYILENGFPLVTSKNVVNGEIDFKDTNLISKEDFDKINQRSRVNVGDIIMPMIGTIGRPVIVNTNREFAIKNVALIKFVQTSNSRVKNVYIKYLLESDVFEEIKTDLQRGGTQKFISLGDIRKMAFRLPPIELQNQFADFVEKVEQNKSKIKNSLDKLITLKKALMQKYFG